MQRRGFVKLCATAVAGITASPELLAKGHHVYRRYGRVALIDSHSREPVKAATLDVGETYLFHYPFVSTPCFLIDLGKSITSRTNLKTRDGERYRWRGGAGPKSSVVAFSAICAHKMSHPAPSVSFINYRHGDTRFRNSEDEIEQRAGVIYCCSEKSVYDARSGARVLGGPAKQPLAAVKLEYNEGRDELYAVGTYGGEMFDKFFAKFTSRLQLEYQLSDVDRLVGKKIEVVPLDEYCKTRILC